MSQQMTYAKARPVGDKHPTDEERTWQLATKVIDLTRGLLVSDNPFLSSSIGLLNPQPADLNDAFACDGSTLFVSASKVLQDFSRTREAPVHDLAHVLLHCLLLHPFVDASVDASSWDLASDMVAESIVAEILGPRDGERGQRIKVALDQLSSDFSPSVTTEKLYRTLKDGAYASARHQWAQLFHVDDHQLWPPNANPDQSERSQRHGSNPSANQSNGSQDVISSAVGQLESRTESNGSASGTKTSEANDSPSPHGQSGRHEGTPGSTPSEGDQRGGQSDAEPSDAPVGDSMTEAQRELAEKTWERAAKSMRVDLETISRKRGAGLGKLVRELSVSTHERIDYREFLRQFAVEHEDMRLSDDEFDYIFYTYGLELYENVPLVEPLEYRSEKRIRDFAIVIDTSSSVSAKVVQEFVDATFDVLNSEGGFFAKTNIHIIQADARVQSDVKITSPAELNRWRHNIKLYGFGGTDFRPAFRYLQELRQFGEFDDLQGLVYFTDGWGIYPDRMPPYKCAFVFYDEDHRPELVPPWAVQVVLHPGEFESMSVY